MSEKLRVNCKHNSNDHIYINVQKNAIINLFINVIYKAFLDRLSPWQDCFLALCTLGMSIHHHCSLICN